MDKHQQTKAVDAMKAASINGDINALRDLFALLKSGTYDSQKILSDIYACENLSKQQKELIELQIDLFSKYKLLAERLFKHAQKGDLEALSYLIDLIKSKKINGLMAKQDLRDLFFSNTSTPEQKELLWKSRYIAVDSKIIKKEGYVTERETVFDDDGRSYEQDVKRWEEWEEEVPITFYEYIKPLLDKLSTDDH